MPAATSTAPTMTTTTGTDPASLLRLLAWLSPAFPTGGFAYSHGIEWAVEAGDVRDAATLHDWVAATLRHGAGRSDAILLRHAHRAASAGDFEALVGVTALALATQPGRERVMEATGQGNAFVLAAAPWRPDLLVRVQARTGDMPYAVAVGALAGAHGVAEGVTVAAALQAFAANLISATVRLVPLGQSAGLIVLAGLEPVAAQVAAATEAATLDDVGGACLRADIAAMRHETQYTRLFRS